MIELKVRALHYPEGKLLVIGFIAPKILGIGLGKEETPSQEKAENKTIFHRSVFGREPRP